MKRPVSGYTLQRDLAEKGYHCEVVAPTSIPKPRSKQIKTYRIDAAQLAWNLTRKSPVCPVHCVVGKNSPACREKQKAELPFLKAARLSIEIRSFPSLPYGRFGFICIKAENYYPSQITYVEIIPCQCERI